MAGYPGNRALACGKDVVLAHSFGHSEVGRINRLEAQRRGGFSARSITANQALTSASRVNECKRLIASVDYCNFAYSALACFRMGMSGSASFQSMRKSL